MIIQCLKSIACTCSYVYDIHEILNHQKKTVNREEKACIAIILAPVYNNKNLKQKAD